MSEASALSAHLRHSAESMGLRGGHLVPLRYGSAGGELAVCMSSVGLVDREDLRVLAIDADPGAIDRITAATLDDVLAVGEATTAGHAYWGRPRPDRALVALPASAAPLLCEELLRRLGREEAEVEETVLQAIGVVGPATAGLLTDLGAYGALAGVNGRGRVATGAAPGVAVWMLLDQTSALALAEPEDTVPLWDTLASAGRRFGLGYVGAEAAERFETIRLQCGDSARR